MPQQDQDKDTTVLLAEIKAGVPGNFTAIHGKLDELIDHRIIAQGEADDIQVGGQNTTRNGIRPKRHPLV